MFQAMDPQLRLLLETVYEATEDGLFPIDVLPQILNHSLKHTQPVYP